MKTTQTRINELNELIIENLKKKNTVANAAEWKRLQDERSKLKEKFSS
jgi:hypothetical protein